MHYCTDPSISLETECVGSFINSSGEEIQREWQTLSYNFDNIFNAILTLFDVSTLEAWPVYMMGAVDGVKHGHAMKRDYNPAASIFYIAYIFITNFFIINLYLGAFIKRFNDTKELERLSSYQKTKSNE